jgi:two-component system chemotaxis response regulator CheY
MAISVLIVDDCRTMRLVIRRVLAMSGFELEECYFAHDGQEALALLRSHPVDLVISDVNMPHMDGEDLLTRLGSDETLRSIPVLIVSSDRTRNRSARMLEMGARGYLAKPFQPEELRAELDRILEPRNA